MSFIRNIFKKNSRSDEGGNFFMAVQHILGFAPKNFDIYKVAFTHRSMNKRDEGGNPINYERLEFVGDAMLSSIIATHLYNEVPAR